MLSELRDPVRSLPGIGPKREGLLREVGICTVADLLLYLPFRYLDRTLQSGIGDLPDGEEVTAVGYVVSARSIRGRRGRFVAVLEDASGRLECVWFAGGAAVGRILTEGSLVAAGGKTSRYGRKLQMVHPEVEVISGREERDRLHTGRVIPIYRTTAQMKAERLTTRTLRRLIHQALAAVGDALEDPLPTDIREARRLVPLSQAIASLHFPELEDDVEQARRRLAYDELFGLQLLMGRRRRSRGGRTTTGGIGSDPLSERLIARLPFPLTGAQGRSLEDIRSDLSGPVAMRRLLQGDVGSGKTLVCLLAMLTASGDGGQAALMAPTEILAEQHAAVLRGWGAPLGIPVDLLTGRLPRSDREEILTRLESGDSRLVVGTHALIQPDVRFSDLRLVVVDEQHRFGVLQRVGLLEKGEGVHLLVMTATPIPRTLALTLYGDLDVAVIDELPPGRLPARTGWRPAGERPQALAFLRGEVDGGRQAYIVYPVIEGSEEGDLKAASQALTDLSEGALKGCRLELLHGRMGTEEKLGTMSRFRAGETDVLVSTSVVEVGIDVPNATVMMVEHAERFGLSQLHQLRGRVGRGTEESYCILIADPAGDLTPTARARLDAMAETTDGFRIAELDLKIRGPGQIFGTRQAGFPEFRFADLGRDADWVSLTRRDAEDLLETDPGLERAGHEGLARMMAAADSGVLAAPEAAGSAAIAASGPG
ncbi:MAG: ATP-dependent DNA helicase RecG [Candidatus Latescibacteria bacterium]|jgi:ATP-dependent DNA helicase RecG|nr:ATP-dependent DNA helicase RecG [Candidatus Latescibacterota bacterium]